MIYLFVTNFKEIEKLSWLRSNVNDWQKVRNYWQDTYQARRKQLLIDKISVHNYVSNFNCLQLDGSDSLVRIIF